MHAHWLAICQQYDKLEAKNFFHVYPQDDGRKVVLKQDGKYLDRRYDRGYDYEFCESVNIGTNAIVELDVAALDVTIEFNEVELHTDQVINDGSWTPRQVSEFHAVNPSGATITKTGTFNFEETSTESTTWEDSFGAMASGSAGAGGLTGLVVEWQASAEVSYDFKKGKTKETSRTTSYSEEIQIEVPPYSDIQAVMVLYEMQDAEIPFTAKITKSWIKNDVRHTVDLVEKGVWSGVLYHRTEVITTETKLPH